MQRGMGRPVRENNKAEQASGSKPAWVVGSAAAQGLYFPVNSYGESAGPAARDPSFAAAADAAALYFPVNPRGAITGSPTQAAPAAGMAAQDACIFLLIRPRSFVRRSGTAGPLLA